MQVSAQLYYDYALDATNRGSQKELMTIWKTSLGLGKTGDIIRTLINNKAAEIAAYNGIVLSSDSTFEDFIALYREQKRKNRCDRGPKTCLIYYAKKLNLKGIEKALSYDINWEENAILEEATRIVGERGSLEFTKSFLTLASPKYSSDLLALSAHCLYGAVKKENIEVIQYLLEQDLEDKQLLYGLYAAAEMANWGWIYYFATKVPKLINRADRYVGKSGNMKVIDFFLAKGGSIKEMFYGAILARNRKLIEHFIDSGTLTTDDYKYAVYRAIEAGDQELVEFFLGKVPFDPDYLSSAAGKDNFDFFLHLYNKKKAWNPEELEDALTSALFYEQWEIAAFLAEAGAETKNLNAEERTRLAYVLTRKE